MTARTKGQPGKLGDRWSAIFVWRAARGAALPGGIEPRLDPEWLEAVMIAEQDGEAGIRKFIKWVEGRHLDDPARAEEIRDALDEASDDPGGEPGDGAEDGPGEGTAGEEWPEIRLDAKPRVEPFPLEHFPDPVAGFVRAVAEAIGCPIDFIAGPVLVVSGAAIGRSTSLRLKGGYFAPAAVYFMNVGDPSSGKSPALEAAVRPMWAVDEALHDEFRREREVYEQALDQYMAAPGKDKPDRPPKPTIRSAVVDDATVEAVAVHLAINPRGLLVARDEGSAWVAGLNQYKGGKGADRQFWLSALYGKSLRVDRKGNTDQEPVRIPHPFLSVVGNLTPDMLGELNESRGRSDGFVERILFAVPDPRPKPYWSDAGIPDDAKDGWAEIVLRLRAREMDVSGGKRVPHVVHLDPEAKAAWVGWYDGLVDEVNAPGYNSGNLAAENKLQDFAGRFALILHMLGLAADPARGEFDPIPNVSARCVAGAVALWSYFRSHQRRARWLMTGGLDDPDAKAVLDWARRNGRRAFSVKEITDDLRWMRDDPDGPEGILARMACRNLVRRRPDPARPPGATGRRPSPTFDVHPSFFRQKSTFSSPQNTQNPLNEDPTPDPSSFSGFSGFSGPSGRRRKS